MQLRVVSAPISDSRIQRSFASLFSFDEKILSAEMNSLNSISSSLLVSKMAITRSSRGLEANSGIERNSSVVSVPEPSLSSFLKRLYKRFSSNSETDLCQSPLSYHTKKQKRRTVRHERELLDLLRLEVRRIDVTHFLAR